ncbi:apolipoprotein C-II [Corythoichthys intestinalis]|uniref:apolipoprotein C-II n=1 Tax=Corythoichthys intestinalis TaxID=161448 RepID=UPI0025A61E96|nr:apolipoprotein C-II [Corythoichthys intestinalis]
MTTTQFYLPKSALWLPERQVNTLLPLYICSRPAEELIRFSSSHFRKGIQSTIMNKLLVFTVLLALLAVSTEGLRMPRQVDDEAQGPLTMISETIKSYYSNAVDKVNDYIDTIKGLKIEEKVTNLYAETTTILGTYIGIFQDQLYHRFYTQQ